MSSATIEHAGSEIVSPVRRDYATNKIMWLLILPLIYLSAQGAFSFQYPTGPAGNGVQAADTSHPGLLGYVVFPGITYLIILALMVRERIAVLSRTKLFKAFTSLAVLAICSTAWSQLPIKTFVYGGLYLVGTLFAYYLATRFTPATLSVLLMRAGVVVCLLSIVMIALVPDIATAQTIRHLGAWKGIFIDRSAAAKCYVFLLSPALVGWNRRISPGRVAYILLLVLMLIQAYAVTPCLALGFYVFVLVALSFARKLDRRSQMAFVLAGGTISATVIFSVALNLRDILLALGRDPTLTGRTVIWHALIGSVMKRPLLGYGFSGFWNDIKGESGAVIHATKWNFGYAHNGYLEILLQLGMIGSILFLITLVHALLNAWTCFREDRSGSSDWYIGLIVLTILYNLDESSVLGANSLTSILYIVACCGLYDKALQLKRAKLARGSSNGNNLSPAR